MCATRIMNLTYTWWYSPLVTSPSMWLRLLCTYQTLDSTVTLSRILRTSLHTIIIYPFLSFHFSPSFSFSLQCLFALSYNDSYFKILLWDPHSATFSLPLSPNLSKNVGVYEWERDEDTLLSVSLFLLLLLPVPLMITAFSLSLSLAFPPIPIFFYFPF